MNNIEKNNIEKNNLEASTGSMCIVTISAIHINNKEEMKISCRPAALALMFHTLSVLCTFSFPCAGLPMPQ